MKNWIFRLYVFLAIAGTTATLKADIPVTNEEFVVNSILRATATLIDSLELTPSRARVDSADGLDELAVDGVKAALIESGWFVVNKIDRKSGQGFNITASLSAFDFKYEKGRSRGFLKKPAIRRELSGQILFKLIGNDYSYLDFLDFSDSDEVAPGQANYIASIRYKELSPPVPGGGATKYLEPLAVTATVGGLIYLFFINR